tara:strand:- start:313 stop:441 length:129 start_codon:yes stop_codon:yes gene_type:complete
VGIVVAGRHLRREDGHGSGKIYEIYLASLKCHTFIERNLEKL